MPAAARPAAIAAPTMQIGIYDEGETLFGDLGQVFPQLQGAARRRAPREPLLGRQARRREVAPVRRRATPATPPTTGRSTTATAFYAAANGIKLLFSITGTPAWANGGQARTGRRRTTRDLRDFAYAAATRYSGTYVGTTAERCPAVRLWAAWNEPNNPVFLRPQFVRSGGKWVIQSAIDYAKICNAVYDGVHATLVKGEQVACGVTAPRGNNNPASARRRSRRSRSSPPRRRRG